MLRPEVLVVKRVRGCSVLTPSVRNWSLFPLYKGSGTSKGQMHDDSEQDANVFSKELTKIYILLTDDTLASGELKAVIPFLSLFCKM